MQKEKLSCIHLSGELKIDFLMIFFTQKKLEVTDFRGLDYLFTDCGLCLISSVTRLSAITFRIRYTPLQSPLIVYR